ncbi:hypothetical protein JZ751_021466 [Albula glossodonta]|uniref:Disks large-associated protein 5 n=1 Tax=Albula glossodonta TaxID=121402 RepID=A0A8T2NI68_9TELE|nr:hypothetical protein JZ751_021466 [Albula glossodonta]
MESRFSHLAQRDSSVSMLRVKMSRRRSQAQKENRDRAVCRHRGLDQIPEQEVNENDISVVGNPEDINLSVAVEERKKMLARYKEAKELQKEKERRAMEKKGGVFKVGVYKPQPLASLPQAPAKSKITVMAPSDKVTRSVKPQHPQKAVQDHAQKENVAASRKVEPAVKPTNPSVSQKSLPAPSNAGCKTAPVKMTARVQVSTAARKPQPAPLPGRGRTAPGTTEPEPQDSEQQAAEVGKRLECEVVKEEQEQVSLPPSSTAPHNGGEEEPLKEGKVEAEMSSPPPSFAPQGFVFKPPSGLNLLLPTPMDTPSADSSHTVIPSSDDTPTEMVSTNPAAPQPCTEPTCPSPPPPPAPQSPSGPSEQQHDVPYFRAVVSSETGRLTGLCEQWDPRIEEPSIPEEMRERVRTAVGQARLLMRERFGQFEGLVDDCALGRGEKLTTCTDLQGFWDMVYYQVEDVNKKFNALKEAESRGWQEEHKPLPRVKRVVKKPPTAAGKAGGSAGASAAAKSRLAAVKAAMRAKRAAEAQGPAEAPSETPSQAAVPTHAQTVVFHGGFFQVESPAKVPGSMRQSSRLSTAPSPCPSPYPPSKFTTPSRLLTPGASHRSPAPATALTPACQTNSTLRHSLCLTPHPQPTLPSIPPASPQPTQKNTEEPHSDTPAQNVGPASRPGSPSPAGQSVLERAQSDAPLDMLEPAAEELENGSQSTPLTQTQNVTGQAEAGEMYSEPLMHQPQFHSQSELISEVKDGLPVQSDHAAEPKAEDSSPTCSTTATQSPHMGAVEDSVTSQSPHQTADYSPSEWQAFSFTVSPSQCPTTPSQGAPLSPCDSPSTATPIACQSPPSTPVPHPLPLSSQTPVCISDSPLVTADVQRGTAAEMSFTEDVQGLDFEPCINLLPQETITMETASPATATDVQMESPGRELCDQMAAEAQVHTTALPGALATVGHALNPSTLMYEEVGLLPFSPEQRERVRPSARERDLLMFTPPFYR